MPKKKGRGAAKIKEHEDDTMDMPDLKDSLDNIEG